MANENPKDACGRSKPGLSDCPLGPLFQLGEVMRGGAAKYGRYNWRHTKVSASVYFDAAMRHLAQMWDGNWLDDESGLPHAAHVMANMAILLDARDYDSLNDDRPNADEDEEI